MTRIELIEYIKKNHLRADGKINSKKPLPLEFHRLIIDQTSKFDGYSITDRVNLLLQDITTPPLCPVCKDNFLRFTKYRKFSSHCSVQCAAKSSDRNHRIQNQIKLKSNEIQQTRTKTNLQKHGVEHYFQSEEFKKKSAQGLLKKYGVSNISKVPEIKTKKRQTFLETFDTSEKLADYKNIVGRNISKALCPNIDYVTDNLRDLLRDFTPIQLSTKYDMAYSTVYKLISKDELLHRQYISSKSSSYELQIQSYLDNLGIKYVANTRNVIPHTNWISSVPIIIWPSR